MSGAARGGVLVAGAINTDLVARVQRAPDAGETVTGRSFAVFGGGKGANQAVAAARSGARTAVLGAVGRDDFGRARLADLRAAEIDTQDVAEIAAAPSGVALITVEEASGQNRIAYVPGATRSVTPEAALASIERVRPAVLLLTLELPLATLEPLVSAARALGAVVVLNATPEPRDGRGLLSRVDLLVVNETEAAELLDRPVSHDGASAAGGLLALGPKAVVVTLGAAGAAVAFDGETTLVPAPSVRVVDTTGAGDAACGAIAARLAEGDDVLAAARVGVVAGSLATTAAGAQPSMPWRDAIERAQGALAEPFAPCGARPPWPGHAKAPQGLLEARLAAGQGGGACLLPGRPPAGACERLLPRRPPAGACERLLPGLNPATGANLKHVATYTRDGGPLGEQGRVHQAGDPPDDGDVDPNAYFVVRWNTLLPGLLSHATYRMRVRLGERELGFSDVEVKRLLGLLYLLGRQRPRRARRRHLSQPAAAGDRRRHQPGRQAHLGLQLQLHHQPGQPSLLLGRQFQRPTRHRQQRTRHEPRALRRPALSSSPTLAASKGVAVTMGGAHPASAAKGLAATMLELRARGRTR